MVEITALDTSTLDGLTDGVTREIVRVANEINEVVQQALATHSNERSGEPSTGFRILLRSLYEEEKFEPGVEAVWHPGGFRGVIWRSRIAEVTLISDQDEVGLVMILDTHDHDHLLRVLKRHVPGITGGLSLDDTVTVAYPAG